MQQQVSVSQGHIWQRSLAWMTTRFGRKPTDVLFRGITMLFVLIVIVLVAGVACRTSHLWYLDYLRICTALRCTHRRGSVYIRRGFLSTTIARPACLLYRLAGGSAECDLRSLWISRPGPVVTVNG